MGSGASKQTGATSKKATASALKSVAKLVSDKPNKDGMTVADVTEVARLKLELQAERNLRLKAEAANQVGVSVEDGAVQSYASPPSEYAPLPITHV